MTTKQIGLITIAALTAVLAACMTALLIWGPQDSQSRIWEAAGAIGAWALSSGLLARLMRDTDGDGAIDVLDGDPTDPEVQ